MERELELLIRNAIKSDLGNEKNVALLFSGGIDSSIIGKILTEYTNVLPITVGTKDSEDVVISKDIGNLIFRRHLIVYLNKEMVEKAIPKLIKITGKVDVVTISVGCVVYFAAKYSSISGFKKIFTGTGSDELFCGYSSHRKAFEKGWKEVELECVRRIQGVKKDVERDKRICEYFGLDLKTPFLNKKVIEFGLKIHPRYKISKDDEKIILKRIGERIGLPEIIYKRKKKAAQYGSGVQKIIKKISKEKGFKKISDFLNNIYKKQKTP